MKVNLHELINKPGYGKHIPILIKEKAWDEWAGMPYKKFDVEVHYNGYETYNVKARCEDEAIELADKLAEKDYDDYEILEATQCK